MRRLAYLFPTFPVLHQTFTVGEVLGLQRKGYDLKLVSLKRTGQGRQQPEAERLVAETEYCPPLFSAETAGSVWRALRNRPGDTAALVIDVWKAWRVYVPEKPASETGDETTMGVYEKLRAVYHCNPWVYLAKSLSMIPYALVLAESFQRDRIGHVHAHWATYPATVAWLVKRWSGIPYSFTAHAYDIHMIQKMLPTKIEEATFVVTCAQANRSFLARLCPTPASDRVYVNYHGTDLERFAPSPAKADDGRFHIVSCGSLEEYKGFHYLLDAVALLAANDIDAVCHLVGDGPQRRVLESKARELGIEGRVEFHGFVDQQVLAGIYGSAHVFAMPSILLGKYGKQDVIPNVLAEAMACGLPVIGTNIAGIPELIQHQRTGLLVPQRDAQALADALSGLYADRDAAARMAQAGREKIQTIWDRDKNLDDLAGFIDLYVPVEAVLPTSA